MKSTCYLFAILILATSVQRGRSKDEEPDVYGDNEVNRDELKNMPAWRKGPNRVKGRVVGGISANTWHTQYQVTLQYKSDRTHFCGGTIYNQDTVISAAHCFFYDVKDPVSASEVVVVAGEYDLKAHESWEQTRDVVLLTLFPGYRLYPGYNDVAILKLSAPLRFNTRVHSIRIADEGEEPQGRGRVSGWGYSLAHEENEAQRKEGYPETLMKADLALVDKETCIRKHQNYAIGHAKHKRIICAGAPNGGRGIDSCQGDSGGPLVCLDDRGQDYLCGIVQAGFGCGLELPGFYTKVSAVRNFIIQYGGSQSRTSAPRYGHTDKYLDYLTRESERNNN